MYGIVVDKKFISVMLIATLMAMSCTSYKVVEPPGIENRVREGDTVRVVTTDGRDVKFKVTAITSDAIVGENQHILFSDITTLERQQISTAKTVGLVGIIVAVIAGLVIVIVGSQQGKNAVSSAFQP